jgi:hypothetical protein
LGEAKEHQHEWGLSSMSLCSQGPYVAGHCVVSCSLAIAIP